MIGILKNSIRTMGRTTYFHQEEKYKDSIGTMGRTTCFHQEEKYKDSIRMRSGRVLSEDNGNLETRSCDERWI